MNENERNDLLIRIDERTKKWDEDFKPRLDSHSQRIKSLETHRNILHGIWLAACALFGSKYSH